MQGVFLGLVGLAILPIVREGREQVEVSALVDTVHANFDEVGVRFHGFRKREELNVRVADLSECSVHKVAEVDEHVRVAQEGHAQDDVEALDVGGDGLEGTNTCRYTSAIWGTFQSACDSVEGVDGDGDIRENEGDI